MINQRQLINKLYPLFKFNNSKLSLSQISSLNHYLFSSDNKNPQYQYPYNFNRQQYRGYIKKVQKAKQQIQTVQKLQKAQILPRRKRRIYDRPKHDTDLTNYAVWRLYDPEQTQIKLFEHSMDVVAKLNLQPKWVVHAFGKGLIPLNNRLGTHRQYVFEDNNLSKFILYEYRNTTYYKKNIPNFDYDNQQHLRPQMRKVKRLQPQEFWQSQNQFQFRVNCTSYGQYLKFCKWVNQTIQRMKTQPSYDQVIDKKFGKAICFNQKEETELFQPRTPFIMHVTPQSFEIQKQEKQKPASKTKKDKKSQSVQKPLQKSAQIKSAYNFTSKLDEQYRKQVKIQKKKAQSNDF